MTTMHDKFSLLATKILSGEATREEKSEFQQLLLLSDENMLLFNQIKEYWQADVSLKNETGFNHFENLLREGIAATPQQQVSRHRKLIPMLYRAAAVIFFVLSCSLFYLYQTHPKQLYTFSAQQSVADYVLEDGTRVKLNKNSMLTIDSDFGKKRRVVELTGEAFFEVKKDERKAFVVRTSGTETVVLGTTFNVKSNPFENTVTTTLVEGSVRFNVNKNSFLLHPDEEIVYNTTTDAYTFQKTDLQYNTAWTVGRFIYNDITFGRLIQKLEKIYDVKISLTDKKIADKYISASFLVDQPVEEILSAFEDQLRFKYQFKDQSTINITGK